MSFPQGHTGAETTTLPSDDPDQPGCGRAPAEANAIARTAAVGAYGIHAGAAEEGIVGDDGDEVYLGLVARRHAENTMGAAALADNNVSLILHPLTLWPLVRQHLNR